MLYLGPDQQPVEHTQMRERFRAGEDEDRLVGVGDDDLLPLGQVATPVPAAEVTPTESQPRQRPFPLGDFLDHPAAVFDQADAHPVTDGHQIGVAPLALESPPHPADEITSVSANGEKTALRFDDQTVEQIRHLQ